MEIKRDRYLNILISKKHNGLIKVITGIGAVESRICCLIFLRII